MIIISFIDLKFRLDDIRCFDDLSISDNIVRDK